MEAGASCRKWAGIFRPKGWGRLACCISGEDVFQQERNHMEHAYMAG